jgi:hypothetical protein
VEFDDAELQSSLEEEQLNVTQTVRGSRSGRTSSSGAKPDQVDLLRSRYAGARGSSATERAGLEIDARKTLTLEESKQAFGKSQPT